MKTELYNKIFERMDELGAIRKDLTFGCEVYYQKNPYSSRKTFIYFERGKNYLLDFTQADGDYEEDANQFKIIGHPLVLSDCLYTIALQKIGFTDDRANDFMWDWDYGKPYLKDQSDELGEKLLELIK